MIKKSRFFQAMVLSLLFCFTINGYATADSMPKIVESPKWYLSINKVVVAKWGKSDALGYSMHGGEGRNAEAFSGSSFLATFSVKDEKASVLIINLELKNKKESREKINLSEIKVTSDSGVKAKPILFRFERDSSFYGTNNEDYYISFPPNKLFKMRLIFVIPDESTQINFHLAPLQEQTLPLKP